MVQIGSRRVRRWYNTHMKSEQAHCKVNGPRPTGRQEPGAWHVDKSSRTGLARQIVEQAKTAIMRGDYRPGDALPGILEVAKAAGCGAKTVRTAFRQLADDGWIAPRRHVGSVVLERGSDIVRDRVLFFNLPPYYCYYSDQLVAEMRTRLLRGNVCITTCTSSRTTGAKQFYQLEELLKERWSLVIEHGMEKTARRMIEEAGWPFAIVGNGRKSEPSDAPNCVGVVNVLCGLALPDFVRDCARRDVRRVLQVHCHSGSFDAAEMLHVMGVEVRTERTPLELSRPEDVSRAGFDIVDRWFSREGYWKPDLVLFTDDYVAQGGLIALKKHNLQIPEDVAVVSLSNKGHGPFWEKPLTRFEMDATSHGTELARAIRSYLSGRPFPQGLVLGSTYRRGATF